MIARGLRAACGRRLAGGLRAARGRSAGGSRTGSNQGILW
jgi:hypothetical protein